MAHSKEQQVAWLLVPIITDAFNRSMNALEEAGAIDRKKMLKHYHGIGSKYYDIVTEQIEITIKSGAPSICELFPEVGEASTNK